MIMRAMEHRLPWPRMEQILNELLVALASFDCHRALALLSEAVAEYQADVDIRDYVWRRKAILAECGRDQGRRLCRQEAAAGRLQAQPGTAPGRIRS